MVLVTPQNDLFLEAVRQACDKLGFELPGFAFAVSPGENRGFTVARVDITRDDSRYLEVVSEGIASEQSAVRAIIRDLIPRGQKFAPLVFLNATKANGYQAGSWTMVHPTTLEPILFNGEKIECTYAAA